MVGTYVHFGIMNTFEKFVIGLYRAFISSLGVRVVKLN